MIQTTITFLAYFFWMNQFRRKGSRYVLLATTLGSCLFPLFVSVTPFFWIIALLAGLAGAFEAGRSLVFFDELMKTIPSEQSASFISVAQTIQFMATMVAPLFSTVLANSIGIVYALMIAAAVQFIGFILFLVDKRYQEAVEAVPEASKTPS
jgi:MFS family permease